MYDDDMNWHYSALHGGVVITRRLSLAVWQGVLIAVVAFLFLLQGYIKQVQEDKASLPSTEVRMQIEASVDSAFACAMAELDSGIYNTKRQGFYTFFFNQMGKKYGDASEFIDQTSKLYSRFVEDSTADVFEQHIRYAESFQECSRLTTLACQDSPSIFELYPPFMIYLFPWNLAVLLIVLLPPLIRGERKLSLGELLTIIIRFLIPGAMLWYRMGGNFTRSFDEHFSRLRDEYGLKGSRLALAAVFAFFMALASMMRPLLVKAYVLSDVQAIERVISRNEIIPIWDYVFSFITEPAAIIEDWWQRILRSIRRLLALLVGELSDALLAIPRPILWLRAPPIRMLVILFGRIRRVRAPSVSSLLV